MLTQNYVRVYENAAGEITIAYASSTDNELSVSDVHHIAIKHDDAHLIATYLCRVADEMNNAE